jgi:hypothetical protein
MENKQTAVEWLVEQVFGENTNYYLQWKLEIEQALKMEKEQAIEFGYDVADYLACGVFTEGDIEDRYNEFFKSEE